MPSNTPTQTNYDTIVYPRSRRATFDVGKIGRKKHHITGLLEIDVTRAREALMELKRSGEKLSFNSWVIKVIGDTVAEHRTAHAIRKNSEKMIAFQNVDISLPVEKVVNGVKVPLATLVRDTNLKTVSEIHAEIQAVVQTKVEEEKDFVLTKRKSAALTGLFFFLPQWSRMLVWKMILKNPFTIKENMGTVIVTNIGMVGKFAGWIIPKSMHNLSIGIGTIARKPWVVGNTIEIRDILHMTVLFDHDVIDGAPAARFTSKLARNLEQAMGLEVS